MSEQSNAAERKILGDLFDRTIRSLDGVPDVVKTNASTVRARTPVLELSQTFIVQTFRHREQGDSIFVEYVGAEGSLRIVLPPVVAKLIARQRDALAAKMRSKAARAVAQERKQRGEVTAFLKQRRHKGSG